MTTKMTTAIEAAHGRVLMAAARGDLENNIFVYEDSGSVETLLFVNSELQGELYFEGGLFVRRVVRGVLVSPEGPRELCAVLDGACFYRVPDEACLLQALEDVCHHMNCVVDEWLRHQNLPDPEWSKNGETRMNRVGDLLDVLSSGERMQTHAPAKALMDGHSSWDVVADDALWAGEGL